MREQAGTGVEAMAENLRISREVVKVWRGERRRSVCGSLTKYTPHRSRRAAGAVPLLPLTHILFSTAGFKGRNPPAQLPPHHDCGGGRWLSLMAYNMCVIGLLTQMGENLQEYIG
ncbi:hypothetical protein J6590_017812 [Homalodisca vitripennis]|nr:hypothetical protein J6590_017812 [Homalodisca vitripennis]